MVKDKLQNGSFFLLLVIAFLGLAMMYAWKKAHEEICDKIELCLQECIKKDYYVRANGVELVSSKMQRGKTKEASVEIGEQTMVYTFKDSIPLETARMLVYQFILADMNPLVPDSFNGDFRRKLAQFSISGETGIAYRFRNQHMYSNNDSVSISSAAYHTSDKVLDITKEVSLRAWVNYDLATTFKYIFNTPFLWMSLLVVAVGSWRGLYLMRKNRFKVQKEEPEPEGIEAELAVEVVQEIATLPEVITLPAITTVLEIATASETESEIISQEENEPVPVNLPPEKETIPDGLYISLLRQLYINRIQTPIPPLPLKILELLIKEMECGRYASRAYIREACWKDASINHANERIDTYIKQIRRLLQNSGYEIITVRKEGFLLKKIA